MKRRSVSLRKALADPRRVLLIAAVGEALTDSERIIFRQLTGRACGARQVGA
jgi:hypothetical protein